MRSKPLTDNHSSYRRLVEDPSSGHVRDAYPAVAIPNRSQDNEEFLEEGPIPPRFQHIKVLSPFRIGKIEGTEERRWLPERSDRKNRIGAQVRSPERDETSVTNLSLGWCERSIIRLRFRLIQPGISKETSALTVRLVIRREMSRMGASGTGGGEGCVCVWGIYYKERRAYQRSVSEQLCIVLLAYIGHPM